MESVTSDKGARPKKKVSSVGEDYKGYGQFCLTLESLLTRSNAETVATLFEYPPAKIDSIRNSDNPSRVFVQLMNERGEISPTDISKLIKALENGTVGLGGVAVTVKEAFGLHVPMANEKKTQFVRELKNKYKNLCGEIQLAPFLRDNYNIDEVFVQSGLKFLENKHGESQAQEKWIELKNYKTVFTDPQMKSKRRILDGEPGYGKSTLALQITNDWCQEIAPMKDFEILILLRLRQFRNVPTVYSAIKKFLLPTDSKLTEDDIKSILDSSSTLILLDGYDEYPDRGREDSDIEHIIRGDMFQEHEVIVTTRTSCLPPNHANANIKRLRLTGFDDAVKDTYIQNVVARGCPDVVDKISKFLKLNPVPANLCKTPLFFAMISYMVEKSERFQNLQTVTQFFRHIIKCFQSHRKIKVTEETREGELDHSKLDEIAFRGLSGDTQHISWGKNKIRDKVGKKLYNEYVRIGILIEEDIFDYDTLEYNTKTRFFHKLFAEWYAAHYLAKVAAQPEAEFEPWPKARSQAANTSQWHQSTISERVHLLKNLDPHDVHYMYRYACGLNPEIALKIIKHLGTNADFDNYTLLCITEWGGSLETIADTVSLLCSRVRYISGADSLLLQKSTLALIEFASTQKILFRTVYLYNCLDLGPARDLRVRPSNLCLPVIDTLRELEISEYHREITEEETESILQYAAMCGGLEVLQLFECLLPRYIKVTESMSVLRSRYVRVVWYAGIVVYLLNLESGQWEHEGKRMTKEDYQGAVEKVRTKSTSNRDVSIEEEPWYHGSLSRQETEDLLRQEGDFLVRLKSDGSGQYILSCKCSENMEHFTIKQLEDQTCGSWRGSFNSVQELINHHITTATPLSKGCNNVIRNPVCKVKDAHDTRHEAIILGQKVGLPSTNRDEFLEDEPWYHGALSRQETEDLLKREGDFLVRLKSDGSGQYILSCRSAGKFGHIPVTQGEGLTYELEGDNFNSFQKLIQHHISTATPLTEDTNAVIRNPVLKVRKAHDL